MEGGQLILRIYPGKVGNNIMVFLWYDVYEHTETEIITAFD
jgi:hypothetical protein